MDFLKSAVASAIAKSASFPYSIGDRLDNSESIWTLQNGTKREDGSACCVFTFDINANKSRLPLAKNAARKLRTLRHPGVIKVLDVIENETHIYIVTEKITPLSWHIKRKSLSEETTRWGLYTVSSTLKFINADASSVHGSVRVASVYTSESGEWKLGGFEVLSSMSEDDAIIYNYGSLVPDSNRYAPPEVVSNGWTAIKRSPLAAADAYGLGILVFEVFNGSFMGSDQLSQSKSVPSNMVQSYRRLVNANPKLRLSAANFVEQGRKAGGFFETSLIHITDGAENLGLKNETEREEFLNELDGLSDDFPEDFFKMKILPELLKSVEFGGGGPKVFTAIMKIAAKLSDEEFEARLVPVIIRLFASPDRAMRVSLLDNLPLMIDRIPQKDVNGKIFPMLVTGFTDTAPVVREQTVKAVLTIISKLSDRVINGELLRYLAKTASDEQPGIRTNTTICLGKIARNLGVGSRAKVLIAAFSRSLRDPFVHARNAALMALNATIDVFSDEDCATKILPALCGSIIDKEKLVRDQANKTLDTYLQRVRSYASSMADTALPVPENGSSTAAPAARIGNQSDTSWAGWAISSFTNKVAAARGEMQPVLVNGGIVQTKSLPSSGRATPTIQVTTDRQVVAQQPVTATHTAQSSISQASEAGEAEDVLDAWGTMDDDEDSFFDAPSTRQKKVASPGPAAMFDDGGEPDFAGWLAAQSKTKTKPPLPRGLNKGTAVTADPLARPMVGARSKSTGITGPGIGVKKLEIVAARSKVSAPSSKLAVKPKEPDPSEDDWGDAWE